MTGETYALLHIKFRQREKKICGTKDLLQRVMTSKADSVINDRQKQK
jgi:hypothetical protein